MLPQKRLTMLTKLTKKKLLISLGALIIICGLAVTAWIVFHQPSPKTVSSSAASQSTPQKPTSIRLIATGDWIAHASVNAAALQPNGSYNYMPMISDFLPIFKDADIRFCNDPILNGGESLGISGYPKFNSPTEFVTDMGKLGCNLVNTASNHSFDFTQQYINNSVAAWATVPNMLAVAGENTDQQQHDTVHYFTVKGVKFAFLAYDTYSNTDAPVLDSYGVNIFSDDFAASQIQQAKQAGAKIIIVSMRWGTEYTTVADTEQEQDAQFLADQGVTLVLGQGSHELQPVTELTGSAGTKTVVWYSLGNFINTQEPPETLFNGLAVINFDITTDQISTMSYLPIYMHYEWTPQQQAADDIAARNNLHLYLLEDATQSMINSQQLNTTIAAQKQRMATTLSADGLNIPLITSQQFLQN